jgi:D-xylose transport system ATP-binding protein
MFHRISLEGTAMDDSRTTERTLGDVVLRVEGLTKSFGGVDALSDFDLTIRAGEVVALVGDNGAGKSTFIKCIAGVHTPTSGHASLLDRDITRMSGPAEARDIGIETVHQDTGLVNVLPLGDNFFLGRELFHKNRLLRLLGVLDRKEMYRVALASISEIGAKLTGSPRKQVGMFSGGQRASILIGRASHFGSKLLLLDEPTAALGVEQSAAVLDIVRNTARKGLPIIMISHNMEEVFAVADRVVVLRLGRLAADLRISETTQDEVVGYITGTRRAAAA